MPAILDATLQRATLTRCEPSCGGYLIRWRAQSGLMWHATLARIKRLPADLREYVAAEKCWWIDETIIERVADCFGNYHDALHCARDAGDYDLLAGGRRARVVRSTPGLPTEIAVAFQALHLTPDAPPALIRAAVQVLVSHHRAGGDHRALLRVVLNGDRALQWKEGQAA